MSTEKRLLLAAALSVIVLVLWDALAPKPAAPPAGPDRPSAAEPRVPTSSPSPAGTIAPPETSAAAAAPASGPAAGPATVVVPEQLIVVDRPLFRAAFTNRGAVLTSFILKKFDDDQRQPLEMVHRSASGALLPLALEIVGDRAATAMAGTAVYAVSRTNSAEGETVAFNFSDGARSFSKTIHFGRDYLIQVEAEARGCHGPLAIELGPGLRNLSDIERANRFTGYTGGLFFDGERLTSLAPAKVTEAREGGLGAGGFVGLDDNYFLEVLAPDTAARFRIEPETSGKNPELKAGLVSSEQAPDRIAARLFIGPKDLDILASTGIRLDETISFRSMGMNLAWIARPLIWMLRFFYRRVLANWGVAILLVTLVLRLLLFPLMQKSYVGMKKMQKLQPRINAIRDKYKKGRTDTESRNKMNQEVMALYQAEGYNPMSGCLPLLVQMPIFLAFYIVLQRAIFLRHAPFFLWIHDLSAKDPTYVLVIVMSLSMFVQQMLTPAMGDPTQRKLFLIMPLMWGFFLKDMPAGLVLYWFFSNLLTIGQQLLINRLYGDQPAPARPKRPARVVKG